jgi:hypothetical protein
MVRDALAPIWLSIPETARRILQRVQRRALDATASTSGSKSEGTLPL